MVRPEYSTHNANSVADEIQTTLRGARARRLIIRTLRLSLVWRKHEKAQIDDEARAVTCMMITTVGTQITGQVLKWYLRCTAIITVYKHR